MERIHISQNIRAFRAREHISQERFGEWVGVSAQAVSKWERGYALPDITLLPAIAHILRVSIDDLMLTKL